MAKSHQGIAAQMKSEAEEPLAAFAGGLKERRKIVQSGIEKLFKLKTQQTQTVNKVWRTLNYTKVHAYAASVERPIRTGLPKDQGVFSTRPHGYGPGRAQKQGQDGKDPDPAGLDKQ